MERSVHTHIRTWGAAYLLALIGLTATLVGAHRHLEAVEFQEQTHFEQRARELQNALQERINLNFNALVGVRALFDASKWVDADEFQAYLQSTRILKHNPGLRRVGYAERLETPSARHIRTRITYLAPDTPPLAGDRLCYSPLVSPYCEIARNSGVPIGTRWVEDTSPGGHRHSLLLVPVYRNREEASNVARRRQGLSGFLFAEFSLDELLADIRERDLYRALQVEVLDHEAAPKSDPGAAVDGGRKLSYLAPLSLGGTDWYLRIAPSAEFTFPAVRDRLTLILIGGSVLTYLLTYLAIVQARVIRDRRRQTAELEYQVMHDSLTGLPNRFFLHRELGRTGATSPASAVRFTLGLIDLDGFKEINDTLGHQAGDRVLRELGPRLRHQLGDGEIIARLGGDEFAVVDYGARNAAAATDCARRILEALHEPFEVSGIKIRVGASIGLALHPLHGTDAGALLRCADVAMYNAKQRGAGFELYDPENDPHTPRRLALMTELQDAIRCDQLELHFQPIVDMASGAVICAEALLRWRHPIHGIVPPDEFIPQVENHDLIRPLSLWVLDKALAESRNWRQLGIDIKVAVNMSARNIQDLDLPDQIDAALRRHHVDARLLELELTETALMQDRDRSYEVLGKISALGVGIVIDDFGTGYSSLAYLRTLPVRAFKIDRSFVVDMAHNDNAAVIVRALIDLAHNIGLTVVAEGIEEQDSWDILEILRCDHGQGYLIARPLTAKDFVGWMKHQPTRRLLPAQT